MPNSPHKPSCFRALSCALLSSFVIFHSSWALAESIWVENLAFWSWSELEQIDRHVHEHDARLAKLAAPLMVNSSSRIGLKTGYTTEEDVRWFELALKQPSTADTIVLVPPLAKAANAVVAGYGFPVRFKLEIFDAQDRPQVLLDQTAADYPNPGCTPIIVRFAPQVVKRARFTATEPWSVDGPEILAMAEMLLLQGDQNLALEGAVSSSSSRNAPLAWTRSNLIDMVTPLGLPVSPEPGSSGFHSAVAQTAETVKTLTLSLPEIVRLDEVRLIPVRRKDVPLWFDYGFPILYKVEAATKEDFSDAVLIHEVKERSKPTPGMNLVCLPAHATQAKYIRLTTQELWYRKSDYVFALAEFQAFSGAENVAPKGSFQSSDQLSGDDAASWSIAALNDGLTEGGRLISLSEWFTQLVTRRDLEKQRHELTTRRARLLERSQHQLVLGSVSGTGLITVLATFLLWRQQRQRHRDARRLRDKLARDLHDEIGSNLGCITLICSIANQPDATLDSLKTDITEIERVAEETADSMRDMVDLIRTRRSEAQADWLDVLRRLTERLLRGLTLDCALPAAPLSMEPDIETRRELYLFCKEVLHNIAKHAQASEVHFHLTPTATGLRIVIRDNGQGFDLNTPSTGHGLSNLHERASMLRATLRIESRPGTTVVLDVPSTPRWRKPDT